MKKYKLLFIFFLLILISGCGNKDLSKGKINDISYEETDKVTNYVKIETTRNQIIILELYPDIAPITVKNFQDLVSDKFYDGLIFHRVIDNFVIQAGAYNTNLEYKDAKTIIGEFNENGVENNLSHTSGVISMARTSDNMDSGSSQFFICIKDTTELDKKYAAFGKVIAGMDSVRTIGKVQTDEYDMPTIKQTIRSIRFVNINNQEQK